MSPMCGPLRAMLPRAIPTGSWWPPKPVNSHAEGILAAIGYLPPVAMACVLVLGSPTRAAAEPALTIPNAALEPVGFSDLKGWPLDDRAAAFRAFLASCRLTFKSLKPHADPRPMAGALRAVCVRAKAAGSLNSERAGKFFEANF